MRYVILLKLAFIFDAELAQKSWAARTEKQENKSIDLLVGVCKTLLHRVETLPDARSRQLITDALNWVIANPQAIDYNADSKHMRLAISPNLIGFQGVLFFVAQRLKSGRARLRDFLVDRQDQFNDAQSELASYYAKSTGRVFSMGPGLPELDLRAMPTQALNFKSSENSAGLELVDLFLWMFKRIKDCAKDSAINELMRRLKKRGFYNELSLRAIEAKWEPFFTSLLEKPITADVVEKVQASIALNEEQRISSLASSTAWSNRP